MFSKPCILKSKFRSPKCRCFWLFLELQSRSRALGPLCVQFADKPGGQCRIVKGVHAMLPKTRTDVQNCILFFFFFCTVLSFPTKLSSSACRTPFLGRMELRACRKSAYFQQPPLALAPQVKSCQETHTSYSISTPFPRCE